MRTDGTVPRFMRAVAIDAFGGPERLVARELRVPELDANEVLIRVDTAGVGIWDAKMRRGAFSRGKAFPLVLGAEGSGTIASLGDDVQGLSVGDAVIGYAYGDRKGGFYADYVALRAEHVAPMPRTLEFREAGPIPVAGLTALAGIDDALGLRAGTAVLIHGATGSVGVMAVQLAKRRGARVIATARDREGVELLRALGADAALDTHHDDVAAVARTFAPHGVDAVLALAGGLGVERLAAALRDGGTIARPNGVEWPSEIAAIAFDGVPNPAAFARLSAAIDEAPFAVPIAAMYSLDDTAEAHRRLERRRIHGTIVVVVDATEDALEEVA
ncbi:MAG: NADP-dependent oxidoreductase [Candidatus Eremiobacteraeota bacterium]|nr:NADP-dependent oxidoreductase [Candidatus Eremiobacteraeota bacterium]